MSRTQPVLAPESHGGPGDTHSDRMPIEELSRRTGVTVRNLRELQTRGLLEPPLLEGRKGLYSERHLARVVLVRNLQDRSYSLASIKELLEKWQGALGPLGVMNVEDGVAAPGAGQQRRLGQDEVFRLIPELLADGALLTRARAVELVSEGPDGLFAPSAELVETARALADIGIPLDVQLTDFGLLRDELEVMAARFRQRFHEHVVSKLATAARGMEDLADRLTHLRPAVVRGVAIVLSGALERGGPLAAPSPSARRPAGSKGKAGASPTRKRRTTPR